MYRFSTSLMCMDMSHFRQQVEFLDSVTDFYHVDIMDGHFVPNLTLSPWFIGQLRRLSTKPIDAHLMVEEPQKFLGTCAGSGASLVCFHAEAADGEAFRMIQDLRTQGTRVGVVLNPETLPSRASYYLDLVDRVTVMSVDPGFAGQPFIRQSLKKIEELRTLRDRLGLAFEIEVDGSCNAQTFHDLASAGAETFVMGSTGLFNLDPDLPTAWEKMKENFLKAVGVGSSAW